LPQSGNFGAAGALQDCRSMGGKGGTAVPPNDWELVCNKNSPNNRRIIAKLFIK